MRTLPRQRSVRISAAPQDHRRGGEGSDDFRRPIARPAARAYRAAWRKFKQQHTLSPLDKQVVAIISEHPEYHVIVESAAADLANYSPRGGPAQSLAAHGSAPGHPRAGRHQPSGAASPQLHAKLAARPAARMKPNTACWRCWPSRCGKRSVPASRPTKTPIWNACGASPDASVRAQSGAAANCEPVPTSECAPRCGAKIADYTRRALVLEVPDGYFRDHCRCHHRRARDHADGHFSAGPQSRAERDAGPRRNRMRSLFATMALMIGCIVGGYAWSALRAVSAKDELRATMETEFAKQFAALAARQNAPAADAQRPSRMRRLAPLRRAMAKPAQLNRSRSCRRAGSTRSPTKWARSPAPNTWRRRIALCAPIPAAAHTTNVRVQARVPNSESAVARTRRRRADGSAACISPRRQRNRCSADQRSVCLEVSNWSVEDTLAVRVIVDYDFGVAPAGELTAAAPAGTRALAIRDAWECTGRSAFLRTPRPTDPLSPTRWDAGWIVRPMSVASAPISMAKRHFGHQFARVRPDHAAAQHAMRAPGRKAVW